MIEFLNKSITVKIISYFVRYKEINAINNSHVVNILKHFLWLRQPIYGCCLRQFVFFSNKKIILLTHFNTFMFIRPKELS